MFYAKTFAKHLWEVELSSDYFFNRVNCAINYFNRALRPWLHVK